MEINKDEALIILELANIAWGEGLGSDNDAILLKRIIKDFPDCEVPNTVESFLRQEYGD